VLLVAVPAVAGAVAGAACGNLLAAPLYRENAQVYQVGVLGVPCGSTWQFPWRCWR